VRHDLEAPDARQRLRNYVLLQIPGAALVTLLLVGLNYMDFVAVPTAALLLVAWVLKDVVMYRFVGTSYGPGPPHGVDALIGRVGTVAQDLSPRGSVLLGAEHWSARVMEGERTLLRGTSVRVNRVEGYVVVVVVDDRVADTPAAD